MSGPACISALAACAGALLLFFRQGMPPAADMSELALYPAALACSALLACVYVALWREQPPSRFFALFAGLCAYAGLYLECAVFRLTDLVDIIYAALCLPFLASALGGGYGALRLLMRREQDDYGRDYYNLFVPWCAARARNSWAAFLLVSLARFVWDAVGRVSSAGFDPVHHIVSAIPLFCFFLLPAFMWFFVCCSEHPLRAKLSLTFAPFIAACVPLLCLR